jgi:hypothetical protein
VKHLSILIKLNVEVGEILKETNNYGTVESDKMAGIFGS